MSTPKYSATVSREGNTWTVQCLEYPQAHTWAKTLIELRTAIREAIILAADLEEDAIFSVDLLADASVPKDLADALAIGNERAALQAQQESTSLMANESARGLTSRGYNTRDVAGALVLSARSLA